VKLSKVVGLSVYLPLCITDECRWFLGNFEKGVVTGTKKQSLSC